MGVKLGPRHEDVWGKAGIDPGTVNLGSRCRV
jgi:hypothetical protein